MNQTITSDSQLSNQQNKRDVTIDELQEIVLEVDSFVANWFNRLQAAISDQCICSLDQPEMDLNNRYKSHEVNSSNIQTAPIRSDESIPSEALAQEIRSFQSEKSDWEDEKTRSEKELLEKFDQLSKAWLRLEDEQRRVLQMKGSRPKYSAESHGGESVTNSGSTGDSISTDSSLVQKNSANRSRNDAINQFQQLRHEIDSNRPNTGRR